MSQQELLKKVLSALNERDFPFMLTGSIASSIQGEPRLSHDIDIIITADRKIVNILSDRFDKQHYYFDESALCEAIASRTMFNLIDIHEGDKIDFWMLTDSAFDNSRFKRKIPITLFNENAWISTPEDTMLAKMLRAKESGGSEKQLSDIRRVYEVNAIAIDREYIKKWCEALGVEKYWKEIEK